MAKRTQEDPTHGHEIQANSQATRELEECVCLDDPLHYFLSPHFYPSPSNKVTAAHCGPRLWTLLGL